MQHVKKAIERASMQDDTRAGYWNCNCVDEEIFFDPFFWRALSVAEGWSFMAEGSSVTRSYGTDEWRVRWHNFIDALASGKTPDEFFKEILK